MMQCPLFRSLGLVVAVNGVLGCSEGSPVVNQNGFDPEGEYKVSEKGDLQWKRYAALEADLVQALELEADAVCTELGRAACIGEVHLVPLGGNDPFGTGLLQASGEPLATTPSVVDRVLLSACSKRVALDEGAGRAKAVVFRDLDLDADAPAKTDPRIESTIEELYRRLLARDADAHEVELVAELAEDPDGRPVSASAFATVSCFAIGSTTEFLFF